jgi:8-oxo-dGTP pyrophosphatase MutT (NUDIX family)
MHDQSIRSLLAAHTTTHTDEAIFLTETTAFVQQFPDLFWQRENLTGHLTGSAWVVSPDRQHVLLIHHRALDRWFQPGGHADETDTDLLETARREAIEESGLTILTALSDHIFDIDVHEIPAKKEVPMHVHYDIRFVFESSTMDLPSEMNAAEIKNIRWVPVADLLSDETGRSIRRMAEKTIFARK